MRITYLILFMAMKSVSYGQALKEYFVPSTGVNTSWFKFTGTDSINQQVYYTDMGKSAEVVTLYLLGDGMTDWTRQLVTFDSAQISVSKIASKKNAGTDFGKDECVLLKMPPKKGKVEWVDPPHSGSMTQSIKRNLLL